MKTYRYIASGDITCVEWQYDATFPSHTMALDYGKRIAATLNPTKYSRLYVWFDPDGIQRLVGHITIEAATTTTIHSN